MNKPVYYKSFRSRKFQELEKPKRSALDILATEENIILDIGFGTGDSTIALQGMFPHHSIMGIEAYKPGVKNLLSKKIYVHYGDALEILEEISKDTISQIYMLFPDPWQKKKHRKRRLFNEYTFRVIMSAVYEQILWAFILFLISEMIRYINARMNEICVYFILMQHLSLSQATKNYDIFYT